MSVGVIQTCLNNSCSNFVEGTYNHALCETSPTWPSQRDMVWALDLREKTRFILVLETQQVGHVEG